MKRMLSLSVLALVSVLVSSISQPARAQYYDQDREVSYQTFYDELSPHGRWMDYPGVGYVWLPDAGPDFRPYSTNGHWVWTDDYEWMWVSDYDWGWAPFHYGRWDQDPAYGWYWVPGYEWSPAWVAWRDGGDYYGWAPIRPGINISVNFNIGGYAPPVDFWCFAPRRYITSPRIWDYCVDRRRNVTIINYTTIIVNNYRYNDRFGFRSGPRRYDAERYCGTITPVRFRNAYQPGRSVFRNNEVSVFRPNVRRDDNRNLAPRTFERYDRNNPGGFRNNNGNNDNRFDRNNTGGYRNNPGTRNNDNRFDRDNTGGYRNNPGNNDNRFDRNNGNNRPERTERDNRNWNDRNNRDNTGGYRNNPNTDRPVFENTPPTRRFERDVPNNDRPTRNNREVTTPDVRPDRNLPGNNNGNDRNTRRFERMERPQNTDRPMRQPETRMPESRPQRQPETRMPESRPQRQPETRMPESRPQRQFNERQVERRSESQPSRQFERRDNGGGNNGNGNRRRF